MRITATNSFHRTKATAVVRNGQISARVVRRMERELCPSIEEGCTCGGFRGPITDGGGFDLYFIEMEDGSCLIRRVP